MEEDKIDFRYFIFYKPFGYLSQFTDEDGNPGLSKLIDLPNARSNANEVFIYNNKDYLIKETEFQIIKPRQQPQQNLLGTSGYCCYSEGNCSVRKWRCYQSWKNRTPDKTLCC